MISNNDLHPDELLAFLKAMSPRYCSATSTPDWMSCEQVATRVMVAGTYRDVCELIDLAGRDYLVHVFTSVPKSWFTTAASQYWTRHLGLLPIKRPRMLPGRPAIRAERGLTAIPKPGRQPTVSH